MTAVASSNGHLFDLRTLDTSKLLKIETGWLDVLSGYNRNWSSRLTQSFNDILDLFVWWVREITGMPFARWTNFLRFKELSIFMIDKVDWDKSI